MDIDSVGGVDLDLDLLDDVRAVVDRLLTATVLDAAVQQLARETVSSYVRKRRHAMHDAIQASSVIKPLAVRVSSGQDLIESRPKTGYARRGMFARVLATVDSVAINQHDPIAPDDAAPAPLLRRPSATATSCYGCALRLPDDPAPPPAAVLPLKPAKCPMKPAVVACSGPCGSRIHRACVAAGEATAAAAGTWYCNHWRCQLHRRVALSGPIRRLRPKLVAPAPVAAPVATPPVADAQVLPAAPEPQVKKKGNRVVVDEPAAAVPELPGVKAWRTIDGFFDPRSNLIALSPSHVTKPMYDVPPPQYSYRQIWEDEDRLVEPLDATPRSARYKQRKDLVQPDLLPHPFGLLEGFEPHLAGLTNRASFFLRLAGAPGEHDEGSSAPPPLPMHWDFRFLETQYAMAATLMSSDEVHHAHSMKFGYMFPPPMYEPLLARFYHSGVRSPLDRAPVAPVRRDEGACGVQGHVERLIDATEQLGDDEDDDEVCCELWLLRRHLEAQIRQNNAVKKRLRAAVVAESGSVVDEDGDRRRRDIVARYQELMARAKCPTIEATSSPPAAVADSIAVVSDAAATADVAIGEFAPEASPVESTGATPMDIDIEGMVAVAAASSPPPPAPSTEGCCDAMPALDAPVTIPGQAPSPSPPSCTLAAEPEPPAPPTPPPPPADPTTLFTHHSDFGTTVTLADMCRLMAERHVLMSRPPTLATIVDCITTDLVLEDQMIATEAAMRHLARYQAERRRVELARVDPHASQMAVQETVRSLVDRVERQYRVDAHEGRRSTWRRWRHAQHDKAQHDRRPSSHPSPSSSTSPAARYPRAPAAPGEASARADLQRAPLDPGRARPHAPPPGSHSKTPRSRSHDAPPSPAVLLPLAQPYVVNDNVQYCFCRRADDMTKWYISCDICETWYHGHCVGLDEKVADMISQFVCPSCVRRSRRRTIMRQSYLAHLFALSEQALGVAADDSADDDPPMQCRLAHSLLSSLRIRLRFVSQDEERVRRVKGVYLHDGVRIDVRDPTRLPPGIVLAPSPPDVVEPALEPRQLGVHVPDAAAAVPPSPDDSEERRRSAATTPLQSPGAREVADFAASLRRSSRDAGHWASTAAREPPRKPHGNAGVIRGPYRKRRRPDENDSTDDNVLARANLRSKPLPLPPPPPAPAPRDDAGPRKRPGRPRKLPLPSSPAASRATVT